MRVPQHSESPPVRSTLWCVLRAIWHTLRQQFGFNLRWLTGVAALARFAREYRHFRRLNVASPYALQVRDIAPCLTDRTTETPIEPTYLLQDAWFAGRVAQRRPREHVDVGSSVRSMSLVAQFIPVTLVDIRAVEIELEGFSFREGSILNLPFPDRSVASISSLCVIEHIGLGRYGDTFDARGTEKAAAELSRVLAPNGDLYVSVPVDAECGVHFNAHRVFTRDYLLSIFSGLELVAERYIYGRAYAPAYDPAAGFGTGLYHFRAR